jgi:hypothetical protein
VLDVLPDGQRTCSGLRKRPNLLAIPDVAMPLIGHPGQSVGIQILKGGANFMSAKSFRFLFGLRYQALLAQEGIGCSKPATLEGRPNRRNRIDLFK